MSEASEHDAVLDQIADLFGGWSQDWQTGFEAYRRVRDRVGDSEDERTALRFVHRSHALQTAMLAEEEGAEPALIVAALLHDIGHAFAPPAPAGRAERYDDKHEVIGALWLRQVFVPLVSEPVRHHVAAKRYLVATRGDYAGRLAPDSTLSLESQGGGMSPEEIDACAMLPYWEEGVRLRLWDDAAKVWSKPVAPLDHFVPHMQASLRD